MANGLLRTRASIFFFLQRSQLAVYYQLRSASSLRTICSGVDVEYGPTPPHPYPLAVTKSAHSQRNRKVTTVVVTPREIWQGGIHVCRSRLTQNTWTVYCSAVLHRVPRWSSWYPRNLPAGSPRVRISARVSLFSLS